MAELEITNVVSEEVYLSDLYTKIPVGGSKTVERSASDLPRMRSLHQALADGLVTLSVQYSADEVASGLHAPPATIEAGDLAPVASSTPAASLAVIYAPLVPGAGGSPDDVEIYPAGSLPFKCRIVDAILYVSAAVGASSVEIRDEAGGAGDVLATASAAATGRIPRAGDATTEVTPAPTKGLFARRSDSGIGGEVVLFVRPEL